MQDLGGTETQLIRSIAVYHHGHDSSAYLFCCLPCTGILLTTLHGWTVGIDGNLLLYDYLFLHADRILAGDYSEITANVCHFIDTLRANGITPLVVFDGERFRPKDRHVGVKRACKLAAAQRKYTEAATPEEKRIAARGVVRPTKELIAVLVQVLNSKGPLLLQCTFE